MSNKLFNTPFELSARRNVTKTAIKDLVVDGLVVATDDEAGILYSASDSGREMSEGFQSEYAERYKELMRLVVEKYGNYSDVQLFNEINRQSTKTWRPMPSSIRIFSLLIRLFMVLMMAWMTRCRTA